MNAYYCSEACQKEDWKVHSVQCKVDAAVRPSEKTIPSTWISRQVICMFENPLETPFFDHDLIEELALEPPSLMDFPVPFTISKGQLSRPSIADIVWLTRAFASVNVLLSEQSGLLNNMRSMEDEVELELDGPTIQGGKDSTKDDSSTSLSTSWQSTVFGAETPSVFCRIDTVLSKDEHKRMLEVTRAREPVSGAGRPPTAEELVSAVSAEKGFQEMRSKELSSAPIETGSTVVDWALKLPETVSSVLCCRRRAPKKPEELTPVGEIKGASAAIAASETANSCVVQ
jgi:hypothetical protein